jgi:eukaryotic-like serine/threonine-protein kinase
VAEQSSTDYRGHLGRYALFGEIAAGGMATVHLARLLGPVGFARTVAIKRLHPHLAKDPDFVGMFLEEARLAARVRHPNVVGTLDVVSDDGELFLVMEYVAGESLSRLVRKARELGEHVPPRYAVGIMCGALDGLHAAHEAQSEKGAPLGMVHRDVSPQNIHVGVDGVPRVLDFGIAKATNRVQETRTDQIKGKVAYMSPEQLAKGTIDRRADVYSASVVLWEALTGQRLFKADDVPTLVYAIINEEVRRPSEVSPDVPPGLDAIVMKGLDREADRRFESAREMAEALERVLPPAPPREIGAWVQRMAGEALEWRLDLVRQIESETSSSIPPPAPVDSPLGAYEVASAVNNLPAVEPKRRRSEGPSAARAAALAERPTVAEFPSLVEDAEPEPPPRSWLGVAAATLAALIVLGAGAFVAVRWVQVHDDAATTTTPDEPSAHPGEAEPAIVIGVTRGGSGGSAEASSVPPPQAPRSGGAARGRPESKEAPREAPKPGPASHASDCDNPFVVDARGIRHPKPQCFKR